MNFFQSVFSSHPEPSDSDDAPDSSSKSPSQDHQANLTSESSSPTTNPNPMPSISSIANAWSFGGLMTTLASKSESVIETYRRDLQEFGTGLRKETAVIREVAGRAVRDLPVSLEAGAAATQESLESVGQAIDDFGNTVSEIISHGKDSIVAGDSDAETSDSKQYGGSQQNQNLNAKPYSRLDAHVRAIQCDLNTYCEEPEDLEEYKEWKLGFVLEEKSGEIQRLIEQNGVIEEIYNEVVPNKVDGETFWSRYFYRIYKVRKAEEARANLVKRAISGEKEEDLSWDVDDDDYEEGGGPKPKEHSKGLDDEEDSPANIPEKSMVEHKEKSLINEDEVKEAVSESKVKSELGEEMHSDVPESSGNNIEDKSDVKSGSEGKTENGESCKDSDSSVVSSQPSLLEEEYLSWDEIEDIESNDEAKATASGSPNKVDLRKQLCAMEEEEELSWDIEDDDEPVKS